MSTAKILFTIISIFLFAVLFWAFSASYIQDIGINSFGDALGFLRHGVLVPGLVPLLITITAIWWKPLFPAPLMGRVFLVIFATIFHYALVAVSAHDDFYYYIFQASELILFGIIIWLSFYKKSDHGKRSLTIE